MCEQISEVFHDEKTKRWAGCFLEAIILSVAFFTIAQLTPFMPPACDLNPQVGHPRAAERPARELVDLGVEVLDDCVQSE